MYNLIIEVSMKKLIYGCLVLSVVLGLSGCSKMTKIEKVSVSRSPFEGAAYQGKETYRSNKKSY